MPTEETLAEFFLVTAKIALQLMNRTARKKVRNIIRLLSDDNFDTGELRTHVIGVEELQADIAR